MLFRPAHIHAQQHFGPVLGFGAAGARMDFEIAVIAVRLARQQALQAGLLGLLREGFQGGHRLPDHLLVAFGLGELDQLGVLGGAGLQRAAGLDLGFERRALPHDLLGGGGVVPEVRVFRLGVQLLQAEQGVIPVKDASGAG